MDFNLENFYKKISIRSNFIFLIKISGLFALCSFLFSLIGLIPSHFLDFGHFPDSQIIGNPLEVSLISFEHLLGHVIWGLAIGVSTFSVRLFILAGLFPLALDADHLIQFFDLEMMLLIVFGSHIFGSISCFFIDCLISAVWSCASIIEKPFLIPSLSPWLRRIYAPRP